MSKILIAFSGGPDSVYLYHHLKKQNHELGICYINHNVRNDVSKDIEFVKEFAKKENIFCRIESIELDSFSEEAARNKRYEILERVRLENSFEYIATGHNKNDNVETLIFRLIRGTSINGLYGIPKKRGNIIRPILDISKEEILQYLNENNIEFLLDYTNFENKYSRNKIRNQIFPIMKEINENYIENISRLINLLNDENFLEKEKIKEELKKHNISYNQKKINEILSIKDKVGLSIDLNDTLIWYSSYNFYGIKDKKDLITEDFSKTLKLNQSISIFNYDIYLLDFHNAKNYLEKKDYKIYNIGDITEINIRNRKFGDTLDGKKIKNIFINLKVDKILRDKIPLIEANNEIISIANLKHSKKLNKSIDENSNYVIVKKREV